MSDPQPNVTSVTEPNPPAAAGEDDLSERLLTAARQLMETFGIRRLRMDDVARRAGCGRATLYRRFSTRDDLVLAVVHRELSETLTAIEQDIVGLEDPSERLIEAFAATVERIGQHPLLRRLLQIEPDLILPKLTYEAAPLLDLARSRLVRLLTEGQQTGRMRPLDAPVVAETVLRLAHSLVVTPDGPIPTTDPTALRRFAWRYLAAPLHAVSDRTTIGGKGEANRIST